MGSGSIQELVKKVFGDEKAKEAFLADPRNFMSQFSLTDQEKKAVMVTHMRLGFAAGGSGDLDPDDGPLGTWL